MGGPFVGVLTIRALLFGVCFWKLPCEPPYEGSRQVSTSFLIRGIPRSDTLPKHRLKRQGETQQRCPSCRDCFWEYAAPNLSPVILQVWLSAEESRSVSSRPVGTAGERTSGHQTNLLHFGLSGSPKTGFWKPLKPNRASTGFLWSWT